MTDRETTDDVCDNEFEDFDSSFRFTLQGAFDAASDLRRRSEDIVLKTLPKDVSHHLINSQREAVLAVMRLGERAIERLNERAARAEELHDVDDQPKVTSD